MCLLLWFLKFPLYRYGISYILIFTIILSSFFCSFFFFSNFNKKELIFILTLGYVVFVGINLNRIINYYDTNDTVPNIYFMGKKINYEKKYAGKQYYFEADSECMYNKNLCTHLKVNIDFKEINNYKFFLKKN